MSEKSIWRGSVLSVGIWGESHGPEIGVAVENLPGQETISLTELKSFLARRAPGSQPFATPRKEADLPVFRKGLSVEAEETEAQLTGEELEAVIYNTNQHSRDYDNLRYTPRPGHADYTSFVKYHMTELPTGGGRFSGRLTAPLCIAGGICLQLLKKRGIEIHAEIASIGKVTNDGSEAAKNAMIAEMAAAAADLDSVGGTIRCTVTGLPVGLGGPLFEGMEGRIAPVIFGIPAVKGLEFGEGFHAAELRGSENNDPFAVESGRVVTTTNHAGGILGGITNGMPLVFRAAIKPTPSIARPQRSVDLRSLEETELVVHGRHDACIVLRAVPVVEAAAALAVLDACLEEEKG